MGVAQRESYTFLRWSYTKFMKTVRTRHHLVPHKVFDNSQGLRFILFAFFSDLVRTMSLSSSSPTKVCLCSYQRRNRNRIHIRQWEHCRRSRALDLDLESK